MDIEKQIREVWKQYESNSLADKEEARGYFEDRAVWLAQQYLAQASIISQQSAEIERLKNTLSRAMIQLDKYEDILDLTTTQGEES